ncbi:IMP cyclohydrolase [Kribbella sp. NPDC005582]|uniref:IMP cyclohydrolase n=1 Tax=Kribbella sp. NPDC005582 TaxID=3156893 RepID=UPI0033A26579
MTGLGELVGASEYPGRGLAIGRDVDGAGFAAYWLTGRSPASKQRKLVVSEHEIVVEDLSGGATDDLRHYTAAVRADDWIVVGNGTQVAELAVARRAGQDLQLALRDHGYEPDPPIRTPRIFATALVDATEVTIGSARSLPGAEEFVQHPSLHLPVLPPGTAATVSTYNGSSGTVTVSGIPQTASLAVPWTAVADLIWQQLNPALRVALFVTPLEASTFEAAILR